MSSVIGEVTPQCTPPFRFASCRSRHSPHQSRKNQFYANEFATTVSFRIGTAHCKRANRNFIQRKTGCSPVFSCQKTLVQNQQKNNIKTVEIIIDTKTISCYTTIIEQPLAQVKETSVKPNMKSAGRFR